MLVFRTVMVQMDVCRPEFTASVASGQIESSAGQELLNDVDLSFVHMLANEDKLRAFTGKLLILHGEIDTIIPVSHATRLCDAAVFATRRLVTISKGHNDISSSDKYVTALRQFLADG